MLDSKFSSSPVKLPQRFVAFDNGQRQNLNNSLNMHAAHYQATALHKNMMMCPPHWFVAQLES